ncbi:MAG: STAS domain-containing protein [Candidatus Sericytochromatia bacterium]
MESTPYKVNSMEKIPILTILVESINERNAHWIKDEILRYIEANKPSSLLINLNNVLHIGHIGMGALIAINNQIKHLQPHAFIGLKSEVSEKIHASHLDRVFKLWDPSESCIICNQMNCVHHQGFIDKIREFPAVKFEDKAIPHLAGKPSHAGEAPREDLDSAMAEARMAAPPKPANMLGIGLIAVLLLVFVIGGTWIAALKYAEGGFPKGKPLNTEDMLNKYDKNRDGELTEADIPLMDTTEKFYLSFPPYCTQLHIKCSNGQ